MSKGLEILGNRISKPKLRRIPLDELLPRPGHPYKLLGGVRKALLTHIADGGLYPPLIVRRHRRRAGKFEIIDGHQRAEILRELGCSDARCEVWSVTDQQAEIYAATLNHLRGRPNAKAGARQLRRLIRRIGESKVRELLALSPAGIRQKLAVLHPPETLCSSVRPAELRPVFFHLPPADARLLEETLRGFGGPTKPRGQRLMAAIRAAKSNRRRAASPRASQRG